MQNGDPHPDTSSSQALQYMVERRNVYKPCTGGKAKLQATEGILSTLIEKKKKTGDFVQCFFLLGLHRCSSNLCLFIIVTCISGLDGKHSPKGDVELVKYG